MAIVITILIGAILTAALPFIDNILESCVCQSKSLAKGETGSKKYQTAVNKDVENRIIWIFIDT